jgi:hypothetical protein
VLTDSQCVFSTDLHTVIAATGACVTSFNVTGSVFVWRRCTYRYLYFATSIISTALHNRGKVTLQLQASDVVMLFAASFCAVLVRVATRLHTAHPQCIVLLHHCAMPVAM